MTFPEYVSFTEKNIFISWAELYLDKNNDGNATLSLVIYLIAYLPLSP